ncbi:hypothetical protein GGX14DRAFT_654110 [Mycena pura]|uniref:Uncharacterized protein n=1 Tax=Mycena pura TaxID=153505 RepID=A0AAD6Y6Q4_9AGAR|nr:hypothetical protein GGX14DRAFT_654110 [Mycena pura]
MVTFLLIARSTGAHYDASTQFLTAIYPTLPAEFSESGDSPNAETQAQEASDDDSEVEPKRQRTASPHHGAPLSTLHSISTTSPVRKKVDITVHKSLFNLMNPSTGAVESSIPLSVLKRAFLLPTRGKTKAH